MGAGFVAQFVKPGTSPLSVTGYSRERFGIHYALRSEIESESVLAAGRIKKW